MKNIFLSIVIILLFNSCRHESFFEKENLNNQDFVTGTLKKVSSRTESNIKPLTKNYLKNFKKKIEKTLRKHPSTNYYSSSNRTPESIVQDSLILEEELSQDFQPVQNQGQAIHQEILNHIIGTPEWNALSAEDKFAIINYDDKQYAQLALVFTEDVDSLSSIVVGRLDPRIRTCVSTALGLGALYSLYQNTMALGAFSVAGATMTTAEAISLVGLIGKRYLGWIGVAWMVMDFVDCWNSF